MEKLLNPTGREQRGEDAFGSGAFLAKRGGRPHYGADFICVPGQEVLCPCNGIAIRRKRPYAAHPQYDGILIRSTDGVEVTLYYVEVNGDLLGREVTKGQVIGYAQDLGPLYSGITPHIHVEVTLPRMTSIPNELRLNKDYVMKNGTTYVNPILLIGE